MGFTCSHVLFMPSMVACAPQALCVRARVGGVGLVRPVDPLGDQRMLGYY